MNFKFSRIDAFAVGAGLGGAAMLAVAGWYVDSLRDRIQTRLTRGTIGLPTETVTVPVQVYAPAVKKDLGLPKAVVADAKQRVAATATIPPHDRPSYVTALLDTGSGEVSLYYYAEPRPLFERLGRAEISASYGLYDGVRPGWHAAGTYDFLRVSSLRVGAVGMLQDSGHWYAGMRVSYSW